MTYQHTPNLISYLLFECSLVDYRPLVSNDPLELYNVANELIF